MPQNVVHIVQRMAPGGIETLVFDLARADPEVRVWSLEGEWAELVASWPDLGALGDRLTGFGKEPGMRPVLMIELALRLRLAKARAVVLHHIGPLVYAGLAAFLAGVGVRVHVEHDSWHYEDARRRQLGRWVDRAVRPRKVAVSASTADRVSTALGIEAVHVIPNGVDLTRFRPRDRSHARAALGLPATGVLIGSLGRLVRVKGHDVLLEALALLDPATGLVLAGDGSERASLEALAQRLGLGDRVRFLGHQDAPERIYPALDLFCLPSRGEGFPRALVEAQACGVPVVATDVGGSAEAVCPATGRLAPPDDPAALAAAIRAALGGPPAGSPRAFVDPAFSFARTVSDYRAITLQAA